MKKSYLKTTVRGVSALALLALSLWFGLLPYYRLAALLVAALILPVLLRPEWTFSIVLAALIGCGASLWAFRASGYHYASLLPFLVAALMLVFRFGTRGLKRLVGAVTALGLALVFAGGLREKLYARLQAPVFGHLARFGSLALLFLCILSLSTGGFHPFLYFQF